MRYRELIERLRIYFELREDRSSEEERFLSEMEALLPYFPITVLHRDDLLSRGFIADGVDDCEMETIAEKMGDAYQESGYWIDLDIIAEERVEKFRCPKCWGDARSFYDGECRCRKCDHKWQITKPTGRYVLVEESESSFFETHEIGFESYQSDYNGARYIPEHIYIAHFDRTPKAKQVYLPIGCPESQSYREWEHTDPDKFTRCEYINPADTELNLGCDALFVPKSLIKKQIK